MAVDLRGLEAKLGYRFGDRTLLERALIHSSSTDASRETGKFVENAAWLGDAIVYAIVSAELYRRFGDADKGTLHERREGFKTNVSLGRVAESIGLSLHVSTGPSLERNPAATDRHRMLATHLEAVIGVAYLDGGLPAACAIFYRLLGQALSTVEDGRLVETVAKELAEVRLGIVRVKSAQEADSASPPRFPPPPKGDPSSLLHEVRYSWAVQVEGSAEASGSPRPGS